MPLKTSIDEQPSLNLTSMMDVVFLLIIFFMVGTKFTDVDRTIGLTVPEVNEGGALTAAPEKKVVNVFADGQITLDRQPVTVEQLLAELKAEREQYPDLGVLVRGDAGAPFQNVAQVLATCREAGVGELGISVRIADRRK